MSTTLLYHGFGLRQYHYLKTDITGGNICFHIEPRNEWIRCPKCRDFRIKKKGAIIRRIRILPIGGKEVFARTVIPKVSCESCDIEQQIKIGFADPYKSYSRSFARYVLDLLKSMTIKDVANHVGVSWEMVKNIEKEYLQKHFTNPSLKSVKQIAIDEISIGKGHQYFTIVMDLETGAVLYVHEGKGADSLDPFFKRLKRNKTKIEAVATDLSKAYIKAVRENLSEAIHVFDHFHLVKLYNEKLDQLRREIMNECEEETDKQFIKGNRWLLLKNKENLNTDNNEESRLEKMLEANQPLATAYSLKEQLQQIWTQKSKDKAAESIDDWIELAKESEVKILITFSKTLDTHREGVLAYFDYPISTGPLEGTNNKIKTLQKKAYGYRDHEYYKLKIKALHRSKY